MTRIIAAAFLLSLAGAAHADGAAIYKAKCAMCHGADGKGGKMAPEVIAGMSADDNLKAIHEGKGKMKPVKLSDDDAKAVAEFVASMGK